MEARCELINTYEVLEHVMGISGLHPHRLDTIRAMRERLVEHVTKNPALKDGVVLDIGCGSGVGTGELAAMFTNGQRVIGVDINGHAIESARRSHGDQENLSFFHGDLATLLNENPDLTVSAAISISVSMFLSDVSEFYMGIYRALLPGGMFVDAPFMFRDEEWQDTEEFRTRTYAVCGCNMKMFHQYQLKSKLHEAGFSSVDCMEHDFDLMKFPVLFSDYPPRYLLGNFFRNVVSPPAHFVGITSRYLFSRTLKIFIFFLKHRQRYASGEFVSVKTVN